MHHCQSCGGLLESLTSGGCGGFGSIYGCPSCGSLFEQVTGGIVATPGGETLSPKQGSYRETKDAIEREEKARSQ